jgi:methylenetetrahydrofolate dehydrogenase (NADP+)/methenyltetrahydrofolate cyclohydrolase
MIKLDGNWVAQAIYGELAEATAQLTAQGLRPPHLAAIRVGSDPASETYVQSKIRDCAQVGFESSHLHLPETITQAELLGEIRRVNLDDDIDGLIVQLPLPRHISETAVIEAIAAEKDADGFHPINMGRLAKGMPAIAPATPAGIVEMLRRYELDLTGKHAVVVGRSNIVGMPMSILLAQNRTPGNCTVTISHTRTRDLAYHTRQADLIVAAAGVPLLLGAAHISPGAIVIDVGIHRVAAPDRPKGFRLVGDVRFDEVKDFVQAITPVPGGVGPLTRASLLQNTLQLYRQRFGL